MLASIDYVRNQIHRAKDATMPSQRLDALLRALDGLDRVRSLAAEQTACIDAVEAGLADMANDDLEELLLDDPFIPFPAFEPGESPDDADLIVVGANGEWWSLDDLLCREG